MEKKKTAEKRLLPAVLLGAGVSLALLFLLVLVTAALIWCGVVPAKTPSLLLSVLAFLCAWVGGRVAIGKSAGGTLIAGGLTGAVLCGVLIILCMGIAGEAAFPGPWFATLALVLTGGCLSGLMGRKKKRK